MLVIRTSKKESKKKKSVVRGSGSNIITQRKAVNKKKATIRVYVKKLMH